MKKAPKLSLPQFYTELYLAAGVTCLFLWHSVLIFSDRQDRSLESLQILISAVGVFSGTLGLYIHDAIQDGTPLKTQTKSKVSVTVGLLLLIFFGAVSMRVFQSEVISNALPNGSLALAIIAAIILGAALFTKLYPSSSPFNFFKYAGLKGLILSASFCILFVLLDFDNAASALSNNPQNHIVNFLFLFLLFFFNTYAGDCRDRSEDSFNGVSTLANAMKESECYLFGFVGTGVLALSLATITSFELAFSFGWMSLVFAIHFLSAETRKNRKNIDAVDISLFIPLAIQRLF